MKRFHRILGVDPTSRGFGFAAIEAPTLTLVDHGLVSSRRAQAAVRLLNLLDRLEPDLVALEDTRAANSRRRLQVARLIRAFEKTCARRGLRVRCLGRDRVTRALGVATKYDVALLLSRAFPETERRLPPRRRPWMSEDNRMGLFDALALAVVASGCVPTYREAKATITLNVHSHARRGHEERAPDVPGLG